MVSERVARPGSITCRAGEVTGGRPLRGGGGEFNAKRSTPNAEVLGFGLRSTFGAVVESCELNVERWREAPGFCGLVTARRFV